MARNAYDCSCACGGGPLLYVMDDLPGWYSWPSVGMIPSPPRIRLESTLDEGACVVVGFPVFREPSL
ncbi:hypothetical protein ACFTZM_40805, partial [Streptomyces hydrogenans]|uniref:hypothetical protein n=1 Tax=Streptomyces hydrogenans TaxID=1873719 RepID=UPI0036295D32